MNYPSDETMHAYICEYVDGNMDSDVERIFKDYLRHNPDVKQFVRNVKAGSKALRSLPATHPGEGFEQNLLDKVGDLQPGTYEEHIPHYSTTLWLKLGLTIIFLASIFYSVAA